MAAGVTRHREPVFSEPVNLTPAPPGGPIPQAQLHRGDSNNNFHKANRITTVGNIQSWNLNGSTDSVFSSAPVLRAPRGPRAHRGQREGHRDCLDDSHPRARGVGRAHTQTRPLPQTQSVTRGGRGGVETLFRGPSCSREGSRLRPGAATRSRAPTSAEHDQNSCKFGCY